MKSWAFDILDVVDNASDLIKIKGIIICKVKSVNPFIFTYADVDIGAVYGDKVYIHPLALTNPINYDENTLAQIQNFKTTTAYNSPDFTGMIEGTIPDFIKNFYLFYKEKERIYLINTGDLIAVYEMEGNTYLVLQKVVIDVVQKESN